MVKQISDNQFKEIEFHLHKLDNLLANIPETQANDQRDSGRCEFPGFVLKFLYESENFVLLETVGNLSEYFAVSQNAGFDFLLSIMPERDKILFAKHLRDSLQNNTKSRNDYRFLKEDGTIVWFDVSMKPENEKSQKITLIFIENTEKKELEERERIVNELDKSASLKSLVSCIAHEINNPNHNIMQNISLLENGWPDIIEALDQLAEEKGDFKIKNVQYSKIREYLTTLIEKILGSSRQIKDIIDDLRTFSQKSQNMMGDEINLNKLVEKTIDLVRTQINSATGNFKVLYSPEMVHILGNYNQLQQVLINLIHNSMNALTDYNQEIKIFTFFNKEERFVGVGVSDRGKGIPKEQLKSIFNHFQNIKTGSNGLGLPISREIIDFHNGEISINSSLGEGTTVVFKLPAKPRRK
ncbi:MAG: hypothetical protein JXQ65_14895 [Candidatus Marinimicrobia bacterium]|nr:hypothetical protein [Candidatus Neomarinimicrobiota bacterium]